MVVNESFRFSGVLIQLLVWQHGSKLIELLFQTPSARFKNTTARGFE